MRRQKPPGQPIWVFGYGSLIWNPAFHFAERRVARLRGYRRSFCLWTHLGRGTPDKPGLMLGLDRGGSCRGVVYRISDDHVDSELDILWRREMIGGAYAPRWLRAETPEGAVESIVFTMNRKHDRYAGRLSERQVADVLATATGRLGACAEYLMNTVEHLDQLGMTDTYLQRLREAVAKRLPDGCPEASSPIVEAAK
jgi:cation transport protein ChaC